MRLEIKFLIIALLSIALAVPVSAALRHKTDLLMVEKAQNKSLQEQIKSDQKTLDNKQKLLDLKTQEIQQQQKHNEGLKKQLQSKREAKAKLAAKQAQNGPVAVRGTGNCEPYRGIISQYNWNVTTAMAICAVESRGNPRANNAGDRHPSTAALICYGSRGLFQIGCDSTANFGGMFDPQANIAQAYTMYKSRGWQPWGYVTCAQKVNCV